MSPEARRSIGAVRNPESQKAILEAARQLLVEEGVAGFSIEAVARRAQAGKPTIYRWWATKGALLLDVYIGLKDDLEDPPVGPLVDTVRLFLLNLLKFWRESDAGPLYRSVLTQSQADPESLENLQTYHASRLDRTAAMFQRSAPDLPFDRARHLAEATASVALVRLLMDKLEADEAELAALARQLVEGIVPPA